MRQTGVLTSILPESEKWGIDGIHALVEAERDLGWTPDAMLRLESMIPPDAARAAAMAARLKMSREEGGRVENWALSSPVSADASERAFRQTLYGGDRGAISDRLKLALGNARRRAAQEDKALVEAGGYARLLKLAQTWERPDFPVKGADLVAQGWRKGPELGAALKFLEKDWIASDFKTERGALLARAAEMLAEPG